jgi:hypothetical protein
MTPSRSLLGVSWRSPMRTGEVPVDELDDLRDAVVGDRLLLIPGLLGTTRMRSNLLLYRRALAKRLNADGPLSSKEIQAVAAELAVTFPPA